MRSVVQLYPGPPLYRGAVAQLAGRLVCNQEATGSIPVSSTDSMLGVKATPSSVSYGLMEVTWRRTLCWKPFQTAEACKSARSDEDDICELNSLVTIQGCRFFY